MYHFLEINCLFRVDLKIDVKIKADTNYFHYIDYFLDYNSFSLSENS